MPVHGEWRHLQANAAIAIRTGVAPDRVVIAEDGVVVDLVDGRASITGKVPAGYVYVEGGNVGDVTEASLKDRRTLAAEGVVTVVAIIDADTGKLAEAPDFLARGFTHDAHTFDPVVPLIEKALETAARGGHRRRPAAGAAHPADGQHLGAPHVPPQPDRHPGARRRLDLGDPEPHQHTIADRPRTAARRPRSATAPSTAAVLWLCVRVVREPSR